MKCNINRLDLRSANICRRIILAAIILAGIVFLTKPVLADDAAATSTGYQLSDDAFNKNLKKYDIGGFSSGFAAIPGMAETAVREISDAGEWKTEACHCMVPQGLCVTDRYIVISAYCDMNDHMKDLDEYKNASDQNREKIQAFTKENDHGDHGSVLYVLDKGSGKYLTTISLFTHKTYTEETAQDEAGLLENKDSYSPLVNHVGGITFDGNYIWIARSSSKKLSRISISQINAAVQTGEDAVAMSCDKVFSIDTLASFIDYYDGCLWTSISNSTGNGVIVPYDISDADNVSSLSAGSNTITIPMKGNGAKFIEHDGRVCLAVNCSYGRKTDYSNMYLYEVQNISGTPVAVSHGKLKIPSMAEEIEIAGGKVYTIYESASPRYNSIEGFSVKTVADRLIVSDNYTDYFTWLKYNDIADEDTSSEEGAQLTKSVISSSYLDLSDSYAEVTAAGTGCTYSDSFFLSDAVRTDKMPDPDFAKTGVNLAVAAYDMDQSAALLKSMGFSKINAYNYQREATYSDNDFVAFTIGRKIVRMDGEDYCLYMVAVRGTPETAEWYSNFNLGTTDDRNHVGFYKAAAEVKGALKADFLNEDGFDAAHRKILISGHSRGAAVSNIVAGEFTESGSSYFDRNNVYGYTYACPAVSYDANTSYSNIYNFNYAGDVVASLPLSSWGYYRYGQDVDLDANGLSGQNFRARFQQKNGSEFAGASSTSTYVSAIEGVIGNTLAAPKTSQAKEIFSALAWVMGGRNSVSWKEMVKSLGSITSKTIGSQMDNSQISLFNYADVQETYVDELQVLKEDLQAAVVAVADLDEKKFNTWLQQNYELTQRAVNQLDNVTQIKTKEELQAACNEAVTEAGLGGNFTRSVKLAYDLYRLFIDEDNSVLDAVKQGHARDNYALNVNSRYFGYYGWVDSTRASDLSLALAGSTIGTNCFSNAALTGVVIKDEVCYISKNAFSNCASLTSMQLPADAEYGGNPFSGTTGITSLHYTVGRTGVLPDLPEEALSRPGFRRTPQYESQDALKEVILDEGITKIGAMQFALIKALEKIEIPSTVKEIGHHAFIKSRNLSEVEIPSGIESLGEYAFAFTKLSSFEIGNSLREIPEACFYSTGLKSITIPETVYTIGEAAFSGMFEEVVLPADINLCAEWSSGATHDEEDAISISRDGDSFQGTIKKLTLTKGKTGIVQNPLLFVRVYDLVLEEGVTEIPESTFSSSALRTVVLPETVKRIPEYAFSSSDNLTTINLDHVEYIGMSAFIDCVELANVTCGNSLKEIGEHAFDDCNKLTAFSFGDAIESVGDFAFCRCPIEEVDYNGKMISAYAFYENDNLIRLRLGDQVECYDSFELRSPGLEEAYFGKNYKNTVSVSGCPALRKLVCSAEPVLSYADAPKDQLIVYAQDPDLWYSVSQDGGMIDGYRVLPLNVIDLETNEGSHTAPAFWDGIPVQAGRMNVLPVRIRTEAEESLHKIEDGPIEGLTFELSDADSGQTYIDRETGRFFVGSDEEGSICISVKYKDLPEATVWVDPVQPDDPEQGDIPEVTALISGDAMYHVGDTMNLSMVLNGPDGNEITDLSDYTFQWYRTDENGGKTVISGADSPEYSAEVTKESFGEYCCIVQRQDTRIAARWITISEKDLFEHLELIPERESVLEGDTVKLRLKFTDYDGSVIDPPEQYRYVWQMSSDETRIDLAETEEPFVEFTADEDTFNYYFDCALYRQGSEEAEYYSEGLVRIFDLGTIARVYVTYDNYITKGQTVQLKADVLDYSAEPVEDISKFTFVWEKEGKIIEGADSSTYEFTAGEDSFTDYICYLYYKGEVISTEEFHLYEHVHSETEVWNQIEPSCTEEGYSGDTWCLDCMQIVEKGTVIPAKGHTETKIEAVQPTCEESGSTEGIMCEDCEEILQEPEEIPALGHEPGEPTTLQGTCSTQGYEGAVFCTRCGELMEQGTATGFVLDNHVYTHLCNRVEPTYTSEGYSGDECCDDCGAILQYGEVIPKLEKTGGDAEDTGTEQQGINQSGKTEQQLAKETAAAAASQPAKEVTAEPTVGSVVTVSGQTYQVLPGATAAYTKSVNKKTVTVPATVTISGRTYQVTQVNAKAFKGSKIRTVTIGQNVKTIKAGAFKGSKVSTVILKTGKLTKKSVKKCLKNSKVKTVKVRVRVSKSIKKKYKKIFVKKNVGKKVKVS